MKKSIFLLITIITLSSCNKPIDKSIVEPIPIEELKALIEKDSLFEYTYKNIQKIRELVFIDDVEKAKWSEISYSRVHNITKFYSDSLAQSKYTTKIKSDWDSKFGSLIFKADSISNYWKLYKEKKSLNNYVKIELFDIQERTIKYSDEILNNRKKLGIDNGEKSYQDIMIGFKLTPLKGEFSDLIFDYTFIKKEDIENVPEYKKYGLGSERGYDYRSKGIIKNPKIVWVSDYKNEDIIKDKLLEELLDEYVFELEIRRISVNGIRFSKYDIEIPFVIEQMWKNDYMFEFYRERVIKEYLSDNFITYKNYSTPKIDSIAKTLDPEVMELLVLKNESDKIKDKK